MSCSGRAGVPLGLLLLVRGGGWPFSPALSIAEILGMVWPDVPVVWAGAGAGAGAGAVVAFDAGADDCAPAVACAWSPEVVGGCSSDLTL